MSASSQVHAGVKRIPRSAPQGSAPHSLIEAHWGSLSLEPKPPLHDPIARRDGSVSSSSHGAELVGRGQRGEWPRDAELTPQAHGLADTLWCTAACVACTAWSLAVLPLLTLALPRLLSDLLFSAQLPPALLALVFLVCVEAGAAVFYAVLWTARALTLLHDHPAALRTVSHASPPQQRDARRVDGGPNTHGRPRIRASMDAETSNPPVTCTAHHYRRLLAMSLGCAAEDGVIDAMAAVAHETTSFPASFPSAHDAGVYMFCDIRGFTELTERLEERVVPFLNAVTAVVHDQVVRHGGRPNRVVGDAFLSVWKADCAGRHAGIDSAHRALAMPSVPGVPAAGPATADGSKMRRGWHADGGPPSAADSALACCEAIHSALERSEAVQALLRGDGQGVDGVATAALRLGFGLHAGWSLRGVVGSRHRLELTYVSPHINLAARLETATKQFGVDVLLSGEVVRGLSRAWRARCIQLDRARMHGSRSALDVYTLLPSTAAPGIVEEFRHGVTDYLQGRWATALGTLCRASRFEGTVLAGPAHALAAFIASHHWQAPHDWDGCRSIACK